MKKVKLLLVGIGGYAATYLKPLLGGLFEDCEIVGCADPFPQSCQHLEALREKNIPIYADMEEFFADGGSADLAVLTTPIHLHARQIRSALAHGCHVLCEKPLCGDVADIPSLIEAREAAGKYVGIGYQWSHSEAISRLKTDILRGDFGKPVLLKTLVHWPRGYAYYGRGSGWAGKLCAADGSLILDSVANNATAHYLHNMLYVLGDSASTSAMPEKLEASLWRANTIENYDTAAMELTFAGGARALFYASHATEAKNDPIFEYRFERGVITFDENVAKGEAKLIRAKLESGEERIYGDPFAAPVAKLRRAVDATWDSHVKTLCGIEAATPHAECIALAQKSGVQDFAAAQIVERADGSGRYVPGLGESMKQAYADEAMWRGL